MTKSDFLKLMNFPSDWISLDMYPDELFEQQIRTYQPGHEEGSEHDRNGAFHWWLKRGPSRNELESLLRLAASDPDPFLREDVRKHIRRSDKFDENLAALDRQLFVRS